MDRVVFDGRADAIRMFVRVVVFALILAVTAAFLLVKFIVPNISVAKGIAKIVVSEEIFVKYYVKLLPASQKTNMLWVKLARNKHIAIIKGLVE